MSKTSKMDSIIGYSNLKKELIQISDTLKNRKIYEKLGVSAPRGLLLYGDPGVGKSLMASAVIEESGRQAFICRKDKPNGDFVKFIKETFDTAAKNQPSIVYLDDMDKFANGDRNHPDSEEYVTVQSCIDEVKDKDVFVLATVNNIRNLPRSLRRAGRFDREIEVNAPRGKDAEDIIAHYLSKKKFVDDVNVKTISKIMDGRSCAELETVINEAGLYAGHERAEHITMKHFMEACLRSVYNVTAPDYGEDDGYYTELSDSKKELSRVILHEAGHAVVSEVLWPESVTLACVRAGSGGNDGFTSYYCDRSSDSMHWLISRIITSLGGMAAVEQTLGVFDSGNSEDLDQAFNMANGLITENCICGFHLHRNSFDDSQHLLSEQEQATSAEVEKYYKKAKEIIIRNKEFFHKLSVALSENGVLAANEIKAIRDTCEIVPVAL